MSFAPPVHSDSAIYKGTPFNTNLNASPGVLVLGGAATAPAGIIASGQTLGIDATGNIVQGSEVSGGILTGALDVGGVLATANSFDTIADGWEVGDTGPLGGGSFGGSGGTFTVSGISGGLLTVGSISAATGTGFQQGTVYDVPNGATVTLTMNAPTSITAVTVLTPGADYTVGQSLTITAPGTGPPAVTFTCVVATRTSNITSAGVTGGTNYSVGDVLTMSTTANPALSATCVVATLVPDNTGLGYTTGTYALVDSGGGAGATLAVTVVDPAGSIRGSSLLLDGSGYTASTLVDVGALIAPVTKIAKFDIGTTSGGGGGGGGAGVDPVERQIANTGVNAITAACAFEGLTQFQNTIQYTGASAGLPTGGLLGLTSTGNVITTTPAGADPVERLEANTAAQGTAIEAACDFEGQCNFIAANTTGPTGPFVKVGRRIDLYDPDTTQYPTATYKGVIQYSAIDRGQGTGHPGLREGLSFYSGATSGRNIAMHLTSVNQNKPVCVLSRDNDETEMAVKSFGTNDVAILTVKATNDFTTSPPVDHCVINMTSQTTDAGANANTCSLKYVPVSGDVTAGTLSIDRGVQALTTLGVGSPTDPNPFEVAQVESTTIWEDLVLASDFTQHGSDKAQYQITTFTKLGVGGAANTTFKRVDFRGIAQFTSANASGGSVVFNFADQTPALPNTSRRHIVKVAYYVPGNTNTNSSSGINMPTTMFYRDIGSGVYAARASISGAVVGMDASNTTTSNQILDTGYGTVGSEIVIDNTFYYSN